jgi:hypothetical protein
LFSEFTKSVVFVNLNDFFMLKQVENDYLCNQNIIYGISFEKDCDGRGSDGGESYTFRPVLGSGQGKRHWHSASMRRR